MPATSGLREQQRRRRDATIDVRIVDLPQAGEAAEELLQLVGVLKVVEVETRSVIISAWRSMSVAEVEAGIKPSAVWTTFRRAGSARTL